MREFGRHGGRGRKGDDYGEQRREIRKGEGRYGLAIFLVSVVD